MDNIIDRFKRYFTDLKPGNLSALDELYSDHIVFKDPIHEITGLENLKHYFEKLNKNLIQGTFLFSDESMIKDKAYLAWEMELKLKKPRKDVKASGITVLYIDKKIVRQRDYFDAGELFYENIPILGGIIKSLKRKIANGKT